MVDNIYINNVGWINCGNLDILPNGTEVLSNKECNRLIKEAEKNGYNFIEKNNIEIYIGEIQ